MPVDQKSLKKVQDGISSLEDELKKVKEESHTVEIGEISRYADKKSVSMSKMIINISYIVFAIVGVGGSFLTNFDMSKYTQFLSVFAYVWAPLVVSVGGGRAYKNHIQKKYDTEVVKANEKIKEKEIEKEIEVIKNKPEIIEEP